MIGGAAAACRADQAPSGFVALGLMTACRSGKPDISVMVIKLYRASFGERQSPRDTTPPEMSAPADGLNGLFIAK